MTVDELWRACIEARKQGYGTREIFVSDDEEGNGCHPLPYGFETREEFIQHFVEDANEDYKPNKQILLG